MRLCTDRCQSCAYSDRLAQAGQWKHFYCNYFIATGKRRPCEAGDSCTVYKEKERAKKNVG